MDKFVDDIGGGLARGMESVGRVFQDIGSSISRGIDEVFNPGSARGGTEGGALSGINGLAPRAEALRVQGNDAMQRCDYLQALNLYTQAIHVQVRTVAFQAFAARPCINTAAGQSPTRTSAGQLTASRWRFFFIAMARNGAHLRVARVLHFVPLFLFFACASVFFVSGQSRVDERMARGQSRLYLLFSNRSAVLMQLRQYENALDDAQRCVRLNPTWPKGFSRHGAALVSLGRHKEAIKALERGLQLDPDSAAMKLLLNQATAAAQLRDPGSPAEKVLLLKAHGNKALAAGQLSDALNYYTQAITCNAAIERARAVKARAQAEEAAAHMPPQPSPKYGAAGAAAGAAAAPTPT